MAGILGRAEAVMIIVRDLFRGPCKSPFMADSVISTALWAVHGMIQQVLSIVEHKGTEVSS